MPGDIRHRGDLRRQIASFFHEEIVARILLRTTITYRPGWRVVIECRARANDLRAQIAEISEGITSVSIGINRSDPALLAKGYEFMNFVLDRFRKGLSGDSGLDIRSEYFRRHHIEDPLTWIENARGFISYRIAVLNTLRQKCSSSAPPPR